MYQIQIDDPVLTWLTVGQTRDIRRALDGLRQIEAQYPHRRFRLIRAD
jgi:hypothetical protein